jgi:serine phosphatase RsbU (regulator of sigma subunit)
MTVSTIIGALRGCSSRSPAVVLAYLNRVLHGQISGFVTCCAAFISADGRMVLANAGHLSPYCSGKELAVEGGLPLGILADGIYEETRYELAPGDRLTFISDGVVEARNARGEPYGFERTQRINLQTAACIADAAKNFGQEDDITVVTVMRTLEMVHAV